jgi:hypothetical protein
MKVNKTRKIYFDYRKEKTCYTLPITFFTKFNTLFN